MPWNRLPRYLLPLDDVLSHFEPLVSVGPRKTVNERHASGFVLKPYSLPYNKSIKTILHLGERETRETKSH
jgi:hypothetical protein